MREYSGQYLVTAYCNPHLDIVDFYSHFRDDIAYFWFDHHSGIAEWYAIDAIVRKNQPQCAMLGPGVVH